MLSPIHFLCANAVAGSAIGGVTTFTSLLTQITMRRCYTNKFRVPTEVRTRNPRKTAPSLLGLEDELRCKLKLARIECCSR